MLTLVFGWDYFLATLNYDRMTLFRTISGRYIMPGFCCIFWRRQGFWHWVYVFAGLYLVVFRYKKQAFSLAFIGLLYLTVLLGPIALVRYVLYLFFTVPLVIALLLEPDIIANRK